MNFIEAFKKGQQGKNAGLSTGLSKLDIAIGGVQKQSIYGIAASPKVGKTTFADLCFVIEPYLNWLKIKERNPDTKITLKFIYFSYEISRLKKEFKFAAHFIARDFGVANFQHNGIWYEMSGRYLEGRLKDNNNEFIPIKPDHFEMLKIVYEKRIIPLFGEYSSSGKRIKEGIIDFYEERDNPTGLRNILLHYATVNGKFLHETYHTKDDLGHSVQKQRIVGYLPENPDHFTFIITDHVRKLKRERGFSMKENIDKWIEYSVELRNWCAFTFIHVIHLNRAISNIDRLKYLKDKIYPTGEDTKDTGNISEECDYFLTLFNPADEKYNLDTHFGIRLDEYPDYRSLHLVESRDTECPKHLQLQMYGAINYFKQIF